MKDRLPIRREIVRPQLPDDGNASPTKKQLRYRMLPKRDTIPYSDVLLHALQVREHVRSWAPFRDAPCVCCYVSVRSEMPTAGIIVRALESGKTVIVPKVDGDIIRFFKIKSLTDDLDRGTFGVLEPNDRCEEIDPATAGVCLIPGVVFDEHGNRIGYGKGYYDRFLNTLPKEIPTLGLAYDCQILPDIPHSQEDVPVQFLVTPQRGIFPVI